MKRSVEKIKVVPAIMFKGKQMTPNEIFHAFGRARGLAYQTIRKRIKAGDRLPSDVLRPVQVNPQRAAYLARYDGTSEREAATIERAQAGDVLERDERLRRLGEFLANDLHPRNGGRS